MWVDMDGNCWLNESYPYSKTIEGTSKLKITRVEDGYIAHIAECGETWEKQDGHEFVSDDKDVYGKVVGFDLEAEPESLEDRLKTALEDEDYHKANEIKREIDANQ